jgi:hypothetical protein
LHTRTLNTHDGGKKRILKKVSILSRHKERKKNWILRKSVRCFSKTPPQKGKESQKQRQKKKEVKSNTVTGRESTRPTEKTCETSPPQRRRHIARATVLVHSTYPTAFENNKKTAIKRRSIWRKGKERSAMPVAARLQKKGCEQ